MISKFVQVNYLDTRGGNKTNGFFLQINDFEDKLVFLHLSCCWSFVCERVP